MAIIKVDDTTIKPEIVGEEVETEVITPTILPESVSLSLRSQAEEIASLVTEEANLITVDSDSSRQLAYNFLAEKVKRGIELCNELFDPNIRRWHEGHKAALADKKKLVEPFTLAEKIVKGKMQVYDLEKRNKVLEEQRKLREQLQKSAEELATKKIVSLLDSDREDDKLKAEKLMDKLADGEIKSSAAIPVVEPKGLPGARVLTRFRVLDKEKMNIDYLVPDTRLIQTIVDSKSREEAEKIVGVGSIEIFDVGSVAIRSKK